MGKKKNDLKAGWKQLDLPFGQPNCSMVADIKPNNIIYFSSKLNATLDREENEIRKKSADHLLQYAAKLDW